MPASGCCSVTGCDTQHSSTLQHLAFVGVLHATVCPSILRPAQVDSNLKPLKTLVFKYREDYRDVNRANWDERVPAHAASPDYAVDRFTQDPAFLSGVVSFDLPRLGDISGLDGVHLQCHIGTDTVSLARLGARMTGLDFSPAALEQGRRLAAATGVDVDFVESDLYGAPEALGTERFDLVYTGIGAICWLPEIRRWANVVATLLRPGGRLFMREGHPVLWSVTQPRPDGLLVIDSP